MEPIDPQESTGRSLSEPDIEVFARFGDDVRRALEVCRSTPALPALTTLIAVLAAWGGSTARGHTMVALVGVVFLGWVGSERLWFLQAYTGRNLSVRSALSVAMSYWPRVFRLALLVGATAVPLSIPIAVATFHAASAATDRPTHVSLPLWVLVYSTILSLLADFALTFVTPALIYTTRSARGALGLGLNLLRQTWPHAAPYVLIPPLAVVILTRVTGRTVGWAGGTIIVISYLLNLIAKGATASYYLRLVPPVCPNGDLDRYLP